MSNCNHNCWIDWNSAVLFHIGVWTFARFVRPLLATILCVWEIWSGSNNRVYMYHWLAKMKRLHPHKPPIKNTKNQTTTTTTTTATTAATAAAATEQTKTLYINLRERDLNLRPPDWRAGALPTELSSPILPIFLFCQYLCSGAPVRNHETILPGITPKWQ